MLTDHDELGAWLRLLRPPGIGPKTARKLMAALGPPQAIWQCSHSDWARVVSARIALAMAQEPDELQLLLRNTVAWLDADPAGRAIVTLGDPDYPAALLDTDDPPAFL